MILLTSTSHVVRVVTSAAVTLDAHANYMDMNTSTFAVNGIGGDEFAITTAATTTIVPAPGATTARNVKQISIRNIHASSPNAVTVQIYDGSVAYEIFEVTLAAGDLLTFIEGIGWGVQTANGSFKSSTLPTLFKQLTANATAQSVNTVQPWFPTAGALTLEVGLYRFEGLLYIGTGATTHTTSLSFTGTATLTTQYETNSSNAAANTMVAPTHNMAKVATAIITNATGTGVETRIGVRGTLRVTAAGTIIPNFTFSANPTGTNEVLANTTFMAWKLSDDSTLASAGTWS